MNKKVFLLLWSVILPCLGQTDSNEIPAGNPTQFPTGSAAWTIDITFKDSGGNSAPTAGRIKKIDLTQDDDVQHLILTGLDGKVTDQWHFDKERVTLTTNSADGKPVCIPDYEKILWLATGFESSSFQWIDRSNYKDTVSYEGKTCYHYQAQIKLGRDRVILDQHTTAPAFLSTYEAWIDKKTLLPVGLDDGIKLGVFTFKADPPAGPLVPPPAIEEAFKRNTQILMPVKKQ